MLLHIFYHYFSLISIDRIHIKKSGFCEIKQGNKGFMRKRGNF